MKHMTWKKQPLLGETYDVKKSNQFRWNTWGDKGKKEATSETAYCTSQQKWRYIFRWKSFFTAKHKILKRQNKAKKRQHLKQTVCMKYMTWKRKKEVTSKAAHCFSLKKRRYIFRRKSFFTQNTKYLRGKKKATFEAASFDETYEVKKGNQFGWNIWGEKGKKK